jgi:hypothetical protein
MALADEVGGLIDATWAPAAVPADDLADRLLHPRRRASLTETLVVAGTGGGVVWPQLARTGTHLITDAPPGTTDDTTQAGPPLSDGSHLTRVHGRPVRIIPRPGGCLATTLTDPVRAPACEVAHLHAVRWWAGDLTRRICGPVPAALRSRSDLGADQEIWALLCLYQALHRTLAPQRIVEPG